MEEEGQIKLVDEEEGIVVLKEYDGVTRNFEIVSGVEIDENKYLILMDEDEEVGEGYALRMDQDEAGEKVYLPVIDEEELVRLQKKLEEE